MTNREIMEQVEKLIIDRARDMADATIKAKDGLITMLQRDLNDTEAALEDARRQADDRLGILERCLELLDPDPDGEKSRLLAGLAPCTLFGGIPGEIEKLLVRVSGQEAEPEPAKPRWTPEEGEYGVCAKRWIVRMDGGRLQMWSPASKEWIGGMSAAGARPLAPNEVIVTSDERDGEPLGRPLLKEQGKDTLLTSRWYRPLVADGWVIARVEGDLTGTEWRKLYK